MTKKAFLRGAALPVSFVLLLSPSVGLITAPSAAPKNGFARSAVVAQEFDPEGEFNVEGQLPAALSEVSTIQLLRDAKRSYLNTHSGLYTNRGVTYRFKTLSVTKEKFTFTTTALDGISYSFTGRFLRGGVFSEMNSDQWGKPILRGQLNKFKGGRKVAGANLKFSYFGGT